MRGHIHHSHSNVALVSALAFVVSSGSLSGSANALRNGLGLVPMMGWSNWEAYGCAVNEDIIRKNADAVVAKGMYRTPNTEHRCERMNASDCHVIGESRFTKCGWSHAICLSVGCQPNAIVEHVVTS